MQGEGCSARVSAPQRPLPAEWTVQPMYPLPCVSVALVVHTEANQSVASVHIEVSDPHTKELLALNVNPTLSARDGQDLAGHLTVILRRLLLDLLWPDPF